MNLNNIATHWQESRLYGRSFLGGTFKDIGLALRRQICRGQRVGGMTRYFVITTDL